MLGFDFNETIVIELPEVPGAKFVVGPVPYGKLVELENRLLDVDRLAREFHGVDPDNLTDAQADRLIEISKMREPIFADLVKWALRDVEPKRGELGTEDATYAGRTFRVLIDEHVGMISRPKVPTAIGSIPLIHLLGAAILAAQRPSVEDLLGFTQPRADSPST